MNLRHVSAISIMVSIASAAALHHVPEFGPNPGNNEMWIYVPDQLAQNPATIVALHGCLSSPQGYFAEVPDLHKASETHGFIVIYPGSSQDFNCWDMASNETLTHGGGSDTLSIVSMIRYTVSKYTADASKVFVTGSSSGAVMALGLAATYPDVFSAVAAYSGLPFGCLRGDKGSNPLTGDPACELGRVSMSGDEWAGEVYSAWPGHTGSYPRVQVWHGTSDLVISFRNLGEIVKQWTAVFGIGLGEEEVGFPEKGYTKYGFGDGGQFEAFKAEGVGHVVPTHVNETLVWFGIL